MAIHTPSRNINTNIMKANEERAMGALLNSNDNRDIHISDAFPNKEHAPKLITDISMLPVEDQQDKGTCVGQAEGKGEEYRDLVENKAFTRLSKRFIYAECKKRDGNPSEGTQPRVAAQVLLEMGAPKVEFVPDDNGLPYKDYLAFDVSADALTDAKVRRVKGYAFCMNLNDIKTAIEVAGVFNASVAVGDWGKNPVQPKPRRGMHRIMVYGYEDTVTDGKPDTKIFFRNSWGNGWRDKGNGWFLWSQYEDFIFDMMVYTDLPNKAVEDAKSTPYQFTRVLHTGMTGTDVTELQKRLQKETAFDGAACYTFTERGVPYFGTYFGVATENAVKRYQKTNGLVSEGTWQTTGFGQLGPSTMAKLNGVPSPKESGKLALMAEAIKVHEGWYPGSRSYRNNNPGNIRFIGQARAIGGDAGGYCIFKTYADGFAALVELLTNAATGKSKVYTPNMSVLDFFKKYAPSADNNSPETYADFVAKKIGVPVSTKIKNLI